MAWTSYYVLYIALLVTLICFSVNAKSLNASADTSTYNPELRIHGGTPIDIKDARYQVSLRLKDRDRRAYGSGHLCGGSVISQRVISTAAHCVVQENYKVRNPKDLIVVMGSVTLRKKDNNTLQYNILEIIVHENYNINTMENDLALLFIDGYIPWDWPTVKAIPLQNSSLAAGTACSVTGWGQMSNDEIPAMLLVGNVPIVSDQRCGENYRELLKPGMMCAGFLDTGRVDACKGDSGGPLQCKGFLTGIVSWGIDCALPNYPGVYTNVSMFQNWIVERNNSFNYTHYGGGSMGLHSQSKNFFISSSIFVLIVSYFLKM